jgi:outer membrane protein assembly factor BamA
MDRFRRLELSGSLLNYKQEFNDPSLEFVAQEYQQEQFGRELLQNGWFAPLGVAFIEETTVFREFGPLAGNTMRLAYEVAPPIGGALSRQSLDIDLRRYVRLGASGLLALRARGFNSWGTSPDFLYFGGNSEMRGYDYLEFLGNKVGFLNAELRFPLIEAMLTPVGVLGGIRGVLFANWGGGSFDNRTIDPARAGAKYRVLSTSAETYTPVLGSQTVLDPVTGGFTVAPVLGDPVNVRGLRLVDSRASYGVGLETFALGFPIHFDWSWKTLLNKEWEDALFASEGGSSAFRKAKFSVWIGYDF